MKKLSPEKARKFILDLLWELRGENPTPKEELLFSLFIHDVEKKMERGSKEHGDTWHTLDLISETLEEVCDGIAYMGRQCIGLMGQEDPESNYIVSTLEELIENQIVIGKVLKQLQLLKQ